jgi:3-dehydroquinate synthase
MPLAETNIVLTGFMGTGKTSVARELSRILGRSIVDMDSEIEKKAGMAITEIFARHGEPHFRNLETETAREVSGRRGVIISTGGGVVLRRENIEALRRNGVVVCLSASPETILERTSKTNERPLLQVPDPLAKIRELLSFREPFYKNCDLMMDTEGKTPGAVAEEIVERVKIHLARRGGDPVVRVPLGERSYDIHIGSGILAGIGEALRGLKPTRVAVVSNPTVYAIYGEAVRESIRDCGFDPFVIRIPDGEEYKSFRWAEFIWGELLSERFDRSSCIVALGGGVIGDLAGFAASAYMRGIRFVQVPTTLLAQVDSSVGGKTGVNHPLGKNMIGAFWQPSLVWIDTDTLKTLPAREFAAGMAEVIKYGVIRDAKLFEYLEWEREKIAALDPACLAHIVAKSCQIKAEVVALDEREAGLRAILNYGHTVGHAMETLTGYTRHLHGEAVAIGMRAEARLAVKKGLLRKEEAEKIGSLIASYGLPAEMPEGLTFDAMLDAMAVDKKATGGVMKVVLPERIGSVRVEKVGREEFVGVI